MATEHTDSIPTPPPDPDPSQPIAWRWWSVDRHSYKPSGRWLYTNDKPHPANNPQPLYLRGPAT